MAPGLQLFFLACWNWKSLFLIMASSARDYFVGRMMTQSKNPGARRGWLILSLCVNLGTIAFFKYYNFFVTSAAALLAWLGVPANLHTLEIVIPVGVSFYTFHSISYTIDVYRGKSCPLLAFNDTKADPAFYDTAVRIDDGHLTREGAGAFTRLLAREFVRMVRPVTKP